MFPKKVLEEIEKATKQFGEYGAENTHRIVIKRDSKGKFSAEITVNPVKPPKLDFKSSWKRHWRIWPGEIKNKSKFWEFETICDLRSVDGNVALGYGYDEESQTNKLRLLNWDYVNENIVELIKRHIDEEIEGTEEEAA